MTYRTGWPRSPCESCAQDPHCKWYTHCDAFRIWVRQVLAKSRRLCCRSAAHTGYPLQPPADSATQPHRLTVKISPLHSGAADRQTQTDPNTVGWHGQPRHSIPNRR